MTFYRIKIEPVEAEQWFPGKPMESVQEIAYDPGDGSTKSCNYGMCGHIGIHPGDWVVTSAGGRYVVTDAEFKAAYEPMSGLPDVVGKAPE